MLFGATTHPLLNFGKSSHVSNEERVWQVRLPDGSAWIPSDSRPDDPRASWIYARSTADMFVRDVGGVVVEVPRRVGRRRVTALSESAGTSNCLRYVLSIGTSTRTIRR
jgi:hypothetical protein